MGIALWNEMVALSGDITSSLYLWDAGTEVNEFPGAGIHQPLRLNGGIDENGTVRVVSDGFSYPAVNMLVKVTVTAL